MQPAGAKRDDDSVRLWVWAAPVIAAILVRLACMALFVPMIRTVENPMLRTVGDSAGYLHLAREYAESGVIGGYADGLRPPLQQIVMSWGLDTDVSPADPYPGIFLIQIAFDLLACVGVMHVARRRLGRRPALAAGWIYALLPTSVLLASSVILVEPLAAGMTALALVLLDHLEACWNGPAGRRRMTLLALGALLGLGILVKEQMLLVAGAIGLGILMLPRASIRSRFVSGASVGLLIALVLTPWARYNQRTEGMALPFGTHGILGLMWDNVADGSDGCAEWRELPDLQSRVLRAREVFRGALFEWPELTARRSLARLRVLLGPENNVPLAFAMPLDGELPEVASLSALYASVWSLDGAWGGWVQRLGGMGVFIFFTLGFAGMVAKGTGTPARVACAATGALLLGVALTVSLPRYRQALVPFYTPFAGLALAALFDRTLLVAAERKRALTAGVAAAALLGTTLFILPPPPPVVPRSEIAGVETSDSGEERDRSFEPPGTSTR